MTDFITAVRTAVPNFKNAIVNHIDADKYSSVVTIYLTTDLPYTAEDVEQVKQIALGYIPSLFKTELNVTKLTPDCRMITRAISEYLAERYKFLSATMQEGDIAVEKTDDGFAYTLTILGMMTGTDVVPNVTAHLQKRFCGRFYGAIAKSSRSAADLEIEEEHENIEYVVPLRSFEVCDFKSIESTEQPHLAIYMADVNFVSESVVICGRIVEIRERSFTRKNGQEKPFFTMTISDGTASMRVTYFSRQKSYEKIKALKEEDWIVCSGKTELYNGSIRYTANFIDYGKQPQNFVIERRKSKPVPRYYSKIKPQPYTDFTQSNMFSDSSIPDCLKGKTFVVFDIETTGLISSPSAGNMDEIIEIGGYKVIDGIIKESFSTFIKPKKNISAEITKLTGISNDMVYDAPTYQEVMPDFFKFCDGAILVGHNIAGFDFKFVDHYCAQCGYMLERRLLDTYPMAQSQLFLANYKLDTVAEHFGITFNHHRAVDDALATAKVFLELVKLKKSLPNLV